MIQPRDEFPFKVHDPKTGEFLKAFQTNEQAHAFRRELAAASAPVEVKPAPAPIVAKAEAK